MSKDIRIKKGLNLKLKGKAVLTATTANRSKVYAIKPSNFHGITPKSVVKEGQQVQAGEVIFYSKEDEAVKFVSPVSGKISSIVRGAKRVILEIKITADTQDAFVSHSVKNVKDLSGKEVRETLLASGCWPFIKQRPYDVIAKSNETPKAIFVSGIHSAPLESDLNFTLKDKKEALQAGFEALSKITENKVQVTVAPNATFMPTTNAVEVHKGIGKHPIGLVSTQIAAINPINKGERVWTVQIEDVAIIGELFLTGKINFQRIIALTGTGFNKPSYVNAVIGAEIENVIADNYKNEENYRIIDGNVLTGEKSSKDNFFGFYNTQITAIPEGDDYDFFGWNLPRPNKFSIYRANMFSFLTPNKEYNLTTSTNGEHRGFVLTGRYEEVCPLDIYPMQLLKAILIKDIDQMEALGIYEVAPEDFALTEYVCVSKQDHQHIVREGLDLMIKEVG